MTEPVDFSWSQLTRWRGECAERFGGVRNLPLRSHYEELQRLLRPDSRVLDIGSGVEKAFQQSVRLPNQRYFSLDSDPEGDFDFRSFDGIPPDLQFDLMFANQVLEHLTIPSAFGLMRSAYRHLVDGGYFLATVPNAAHPIRQWGDATHVTAWNMFDLYGLFRAVGFHVRSLTHYNKHPLTRSPIKRIIVNIVCEVFRMDWCDSVMIVGEKKIAQDA